MLVTYRSYNAHKIYIENEINTGANIDRKTYFMSYAIFTRVLIITDICRYVRVYGISIEVAFSNKYIKLL